MILAMPYENGEVFQHFGKSKEFQLYEVENGKILASRVMSAGENGHSALADMLGKLGVTVLVCGPVEQVMEEYLAGRLSASAGATCDHHHEEGHSCHGGASCCH